MSASTKVLLALRLGPTKAHVCRTCYSYSPKKKLKKTIPSRQSLLGPRHPGSGAVTRHDLALPPPPPNRPKLRSPSRGRCRVLGRIRLRRRPSRRLPASRGDFFFFGDRDRDCILLLCCVARVGFNFVYRNPCDWENDPDQRFPENSMTFMPARKGWVTTPAYYLRDEQSASLRSPCLLRDDGTRPRWRSRRP